VLLESGIEHDVGSGFGVFDVKVCQHDVLPGTDSSSDCQTDRTRSDDHYDVAHGSSPVS
jgi:hypothetical protein